jgi:hypothetical protein
VIPSWEPPRSAWADTMASYVDENDLAEATLTVENARDEPVTLFASSGAFDVRLGVVPARSRATLRFPRSVLGGNEPLRIFVRAETGRNVSSPLVRVQRGQHLGLRVPRY